ncbi:Tfp pilus assembly protein PilF [Nonlabens sp. Hel1_33_55]|uniref:tetratricopeptide repeat protein n=1 Tax=Nonlabens sp. Hel1_33_55 TaxID=1336802 RepID=UPI000875E689|nr:tetratricopeptide repeat protein [Nonlabens sp. Hel1_33_55]SCY32752.1 Tfp pilus assembly protein PilF [Nonlabens sp. Hel1_33_55]
MRFFKNVDSNHQHKLAVEELNRGRVNNALELLNQSLEKHGDHLASLQLRANIYSNLNIWDKTLLDYLKIKSLESNFSNINLWIGNSYFFIRNYKLAIEYLSLHINVYSGYFEAYLNRGYSFMALGKNNDALEDFDCAINIVPRNIQLHVAKANILEELHEYEKALQSFDKAIKLESEESSTFSSLLNKIDFLQRINEIDKAISILSDVINDNPYNPSLYLKRGNLNKAIDEFELAKKDYQIVLNYGVFEVKNLIRTLSQQ